MTGTNSGRIPALPLERAAEKLPAVSPSFPAPVLGADAFGDPHWAGKGLQQEGPAVNAVPASSGWPAQRKLALASASLGIAGLAAGAILGGLAMAKNSDSKAHCSSVDPNACTQQGVSERSEAETFADISTVTLIASGVLTATGAILWVTVPISKTAQTGSVALVPAAVGADVGLALRGTW